jgi:hypothetical protein
MRFFFAALLASFVAFVVIANEKTEKRSAHQIGHMVFFKLKDGTAENRAKLVEACKKYLSNHDGTVYFSAGTIAAGFDRDVNDKDFDVALHLVFEDKAAHDKYQEHDRHKQFIAENKDAWAKVRVFDSEIEAPAKK